VWASALALSLRDGASREEVLREASDWLELLRFEYFPPEDEDVRRRKLEPILNHILERGWVHQEPATGLSVSSDGRRWLAFLGAQIKPVLEAYAACFQAVHILEGSGSRKQLMQEGQSVLKELLTLGEAYFPEGLSAVTFGNALGLLLGEKVLSCDGNPNQPDACFERGPRWVHLQELRRRLAGALRSR
jgi:glycerol-3-phosphate O-acyltransferase